MKDIKIKTMSKQEQVEAKIRELCPDLQKQAVICPVCYGKGKVMAGFYSFSSYLSTNLSDEICKSCAGKGYLII